MPEEITNTTRAGWARAALNEYIGETRYGNPDYDLVPDNKDNNEEVIGDFLSDLRHLCDELGIRWETVDSSGAMHHREEVAEERIAASKNLTTEIQDLLTPDPWGQAEVADARKRHAATRLEYLRIQLTEECISTEELVELQSLAPYIDKGDVQLLEAAGVPEFPEEGK